MFKFPLFVLGLKKSGPFILYCKVTLMPLRKFYSCFKFKHFSVFGLLIVGIILGFVIRACFLGDGLVYLLLLWESPIFLFVECLGVASMFNLHAMVVSCNVCI